MVVSRPLLSPSNCGFLSFPASAPLSFLSSSSSSSRRRRRRRRRGGGGGPAIPFCCSCFSSSTAIPAPIHSRRYAILGAGFAGLSVAWHLLQLSTDTLHISIEVFDENGIGGGASGVSGGLLHPYTPKGKLVWNGVDGWSSALELLNVAKAAYRQDFNEMHEHLKPLAWRRGILRPPASQKHCEDFRKFVKLSSGEHKELAGLSCIEGSVANKLLPGLDVSPDNLVLHIAEGLNIHPLRYLQALWRACELHVEHNSKECRHSHALLSKEHITSLSDLAGIYDGVIICLGAGVSRLKELDSKLPITYCRGVVVNLELPPEKQDELKFEGPCIVGDTWVAAQGLHNLILGATKDWDNCNMSAIVEAEAAVAACAQLSKKVSTFYPSINHWLLQEAHAGVRAMAPRTPWGKLPLIGCIDEIVNVESLRKLQFPYYWIFGGLGSRGLIYHAWLGKKIAQAVVSRSEASLPKEFLSWKSDRKY